MWKPAIDTGLGFSEKAVWSRATRRKASTPAEAKGERDAVMALGFKIQIFAEELGSRVLIWWLKGHDSVLFESFCGMVKRKLEE
jgi:23S rRNA (adenine1618-N6)-methyltransferase